MEQRGFTLANSFKAGRRLGFFGTGNAEYLFIRSKSAGN